MTEPSDYLEFFGGSRVLSNYGRRRCLSTGIQAQMPSLTAYNCTATSPQTKEPRSRNLPPVTLIQMGHLIPPVAHLRSFGYLMDISRIFHYLLAGSHSVNIHKPFPAVLNKDVSIVSISYLRATIVETNISLGGLLNKTNMLSTTKFMSRLMETKPLCPSKCLPINLTCSWYFVRTTLKRSACFPLSRRALDLCTL